MRLTIHEDGFGYSPDGVRYFRLSNGRWLRAILCTAPVSVAQMPSAWDVLSPPPSRLVYRYGDENHVYINPLTPS